MSPQFVLQPDAATGIDTQIVDGANASSNFGSDAGAIIGKAVSGKATLCYRFLLRFDVASIPPAAVIANATLTLVTAINVNATEATFDAYRLTRSDWTELGATWNQYDGIHDWATPGGDFTTDNSASGMLDADDELIIATLAPLVADAIAFRNGMLELAIVGPEEGESSYTIVGTSDASGDPSLRPLLVVEYGFEPQLAVTDHGDNTGATASLGGTAEGSTVVYVQSFAGELGQGDWTAAGSITGDGDVELALPAGHYFAYAGRRPSTRCPTFRRSRISLSPTGSNQFTAAA